MIPQDMSQHIVQTERQWAIEQTRSAARLRFVRSLLMLATVLLVLSFASSKLGLLPIGGTPGLIILTLIFLHDCRIGQNPWLVHGVVERKFAAGDSRTTQLSIDLAVLDCREMLANGALQTVRSSTTPRTYTVGYSVFAPCQTGDQIVLLIGPDRTGLKLV